ncbi:phosphatidate cytidylyltransferase [Bosea sp. (in: a-proteobacteria)]|uniref:phosphatidate cytidylyltransferase n=1 Tax=Bosea sp. (in: a-proteobacteria) TaxID=1871050 RepID=UPI000B286E5D|nr:phosphatidate cytidylyltransferase [Bosea sp. (in: a-proteobacteria)]MBN9440412.1 phosphatidate cytidylyltransferase [Bosea sp. (in: a-proteobacteria)]MBN9445757.1 phosphatidate cytidylyltransferase [Bosea sp. (in: a-proteobacteria)]
MSERSGDTVKGVASELRLRVLSALVLAAIVLSVTLLGGPVFRLVWVLVAGVVAYEWLAIVGARNPIAGGVGVVLAGFALGFAPLSDPALAGVSAVLAFAGAVTTTRVEDRRALEACGVAYALCFALVTPALRQVPEIGLFLIGWTFAVVWFTDIAAYFTGRALGGPKLMPSVSPKKTWSGALGGALAGTAGGMAVWALMPATAGLGFGVVLAISLAASVVSQAGDLFESAIKRRFGTKDSSRLIPGHGGFLDRLDGYWAVLVFAGMLLYLARLGH